MMFQFVEKDAIQCKVIANDLANVDVILDFTATNANVVSHYPVASTERNHLFSFLLSLPAVGCFSFKFFHVFHCSCNVSFECVCNKGWDGLFCSERKLSLACKKYVDENFKFNLFVSLTAICRNDCHQTRGYCEMPSECRCRLGWAGPTCKECQVLPGCQHGSCTKPLECKCHPGWMGILCHIRKHLKSRLLFRKETFFFFQFHFLICSNLRQKV